MLKFILFLELYIKYGALLETMAQVNSKSSRYQVPNNWSNCPIVLHRMFATRSRVADYGCYVWVSSLGSNIAAVFVGPLITMITDRTMNALWTVAEVEKRFGLLLTQLNNLHPQLSNEFDQTIIPLLDEFRATYHLVKALKYDLMSTARKQ